MRSNHLSYRPISLPQAGPQGTAQAGGASSGFPQSCRLQIQLMKGHEDGGLMFFGMEEALSLARHRSARPRTLSADILRKEVIQPQVPLRLPCYDFTPVAKPTVVACLSLLS